MGPLGYSIPYLFVALILFILYRLEQGLIRRHMSVTSVRTIAFAIMLIFIGLRGHLYTDFISYFPYFNKLGSISESSDFFSYFEPGFVLYSKIIKSIYPNYFFWIFVNTFIDLFALSFLFKRYCKSMILPFIFFIAFQGLNIEINLLRNMKALDCFFFSIPYLLDRKIWKYMAWNILGITFHYSALLFIPLYFVLIYEFPKYIIWISIVIANVVYWANLHFISDLFSNIITNEVLAGRIEGYINMTEGYAFSIGYFERTLTIILFTLLYKKLKGMSKASTVFYNCSLLFYIFHIMFADVLIFSERFSILFIIGNWINYSNVVCCKYKYKNFVNAGITLLVLLKISLSYYSIDTKYQNILTGIDGYNIREREVMKKYKKK